MQSQIRENSTSVDNSIVKLVAMFSPEGWFGIEKNHDFFSFKTMSILQTIVLL